MMPDANVNHESRLSRVEQRVTDLDTKVTTLMPVAGSVGILTERVETLRRDLASYALAVGKLDDEIEQREKDTRKERRDARLAMWGLTATIFAALIVAAVTILTSGVH